MGVAETGLFEGTRGTTRTVSNLRRLSRFAERALPIAILTVAATSVPVMILRPEGLARMRSLQRELDQAHEENAQLTREVDGLRAEVQGLRDDPKAVEKIARDELGLIRKSEIVFQFGKAQ